MCTTRTYYCIPIFDCLYQNVFWLCRMTTWIKEVVSFFPFEKVIVKRLVQVSVIKSELRKLLFTQYWRPTNHGKNKLLLNNTFQHLFILNIDHKKHQPEYDEYIKNQCVLSYSNSLYNLLCQTRFSLHNFIWYYFQYISILQRIKRYISITLFSFSLCLYSVFQCLTFW